MRRLLNRLGIGHRVLERALERELRYHVDRRAQDLIATGTPAPEAHRRAALEIGGIARTREAVRTTWAPPLLADFAHDIEHGLHALGRRPLLTIVACASIAFGVGANCAVFSVRKAVLLTPLPYPRSDRIVMISTEEGAAPVRPAQPTVPEYVAWRDRTRSFEAVATYGFLAGNLEDESGGPPERVLTLRCTASLFQVVGVTPVVGRSFTAGEDPIDGPSMVVVISDRLWAQRFGRAADVIGRTIRIDGASKTIVGIMPPGFSFADETVDIWTPETLSRSRLQGSARGWPVVARLREGITIAQAEADASAVVAELGRARGSAVPLSAAVQPVAEALYGGYRKPLVVMQGIAAILLVLACANVSGLLLVDVMGRRHDLAVQQAIGATKRRLMRRVMTEHLLLALIGGTVAAALGAATAVALVSHAPVTVPRVALIGIDGRMLMFVAAVSGVAALLISSLPAAFVWTTAAVEAARPAGRTVTEAPVVQRARTALVALQVAAAMVLVVGLGLLATTFVKLRTNPLGGDRRDVITFRLEFPPTRFSRTVGSHEGFPLLQVSPVPAQVIDDVWTRLAALPGIASAGAINFAPFSGEVPALPFRIDDDATVGADVPNAAASAIIVTPGFFSTLRIPILAGRDVERSDTAASPWVAVINQTMARTFWPEGDALGHRIRLTLVPDDRDREIVGIVGDIRASVDAHETRPVLYTPLVQQPPHNRAPYDGERLRMTFLARTRLPPDALTPAIAGIVAGDISGLPTPTVTRLDRDVVDRLSGYRYLVNLMGACAVIAVVLAAIGIYGVMTHLITQRTRELGVRIALGAGGLDVWRLVLRRMRWVMAGGLSIGTLAAGVLSRFIAGALWGVTPTDASVYIIAASVLLVAAFGAAVVPVRRALSIAPVRALRFE